MCRLSRLSKCEIKLGTLHCLQVIVAVRLLLVAGYHSSGCDLLVTTGKNLLVVCDHYGDSLFYFSEAILRSQIKTISRRYS